VLPGLVNTHHHFYQTLTRAHPSAINKALFAWLVALSDLGGLPNHLRLAPGSLDRALSPAAPPPPTIIISTRGLENAGRHRSRGRGLGMRMTVSRGSMNLSAKDGGLPPDSVVQDEETILADSERVRKLFHDQSQRTSASGSRLARRSRLQISWRSAPLAERADCQLHTHLCETEDEEELCLKMGAA
jgi:8-oxoguanine deaminase